MKKMQRFVDPRTAAIPVLAMIVEKLRVLDIERRFFPHFATPPPANGEFPRLDMAADEMAEFSSVRERRAMASRKTSTRAVVSCETFAIVSPPGMLQHGSTARPHQIRIRILLSLRLW